MTPPKKPLSTRERARRAKQALAAAPALPPVAEEAPDSQIALMVSKLPPDALQLEIPDVVEAAIARRQGRLQQLQQMMQQEQQAIDELVQLELSRAGHLAEKFSAVGTDTRDKQHVKMLCVPKKRLAAYQQALGAK